MSDRGKIMGYAFEARVKNTDWRTYHSISLVLQKRTIWGAIARPNHTTPSITVEPRKAETIHVEYFDGEDAAGWRIVGVVVDNTEHAVSEIKVRKPLFA
jgi:hypothetical protein